MLAFAIGKEDEVSYTFIPKTGETDLHIRHRNDEHLVIRFLEPEAVDLFAEMIEAMKFGSRKVFK